MRKLRLFTAILLTVLYLQFCGEFTEAAQTINGKTIGSVEDTTGEISNSQRRRWISDSDFLIDGGTTASYWFGDLQYLKATH